MDQIPSPHLYSRMHERIIIDHETIEQKQANWLKESYGTRVVEGIISRLAKHLHLFSPHFSHITFEIFRKVIRFQFQLFNQLKVYGKEKIPKTGCIFYVNHPGAYDPLILISSMPYQVGAFVHWNQSWFMDVVEKLYGVISRRHRDTREIMVERMIRQILTKNHYFAIWPEGHPNTTGLVEQGFTSIVRVYSVLNADKNRIPFVPVLLRGGGVYMHKPGIHRGPIDVHFMDPFFIDREWLGPIEEGGKTPREIMDFMMHKLARKVGQKTFITNPTLDIKKKLYSIPAPYQHHIRHHYHHLRRLDRERSNVNTIYGLKGYADRSFLGLSQQILENIPLSKNEDDPKPLPAPNFHSIHHTLQTTLCTACQKVSGFKIESHDLIINKPSYFDRFSCRCLNCGQYTEMIFDISAGIFERGWHRPIKKKKKN